MGESSDLRQGDRLRLNDHRSVTCWPGAYGNAEGYLIGLLVGDGNLQSDKAIISVWPQAVGHEGVMAEALRGCPGTLRIAATSPAGAWRRTATTCLVLAAVKRDSRAAGHESPQQDPDAGAGANVLGLLPWLPARLLRR